MIVIMATPAHKRHLDATTFQCDGKVASDLRNGTTNRRVRRQHQYAHNSAPRPPWMTLPARLTFRGPGLS